MRFPLRDQANEAHIAATAVVGGGEAGGESTLLENIDGAVTSRRETVTDALPICWRSQDGTSCLPGRGTMLRMTSVKSWTIQVFRSKCRRHRMLGVPKTSICCEKPGSSVKIGIDVKYGGDGS